MFCDTCKFPIELKFSYISSAITIVGCVFNKSDIQIRSESLLAIPVGLLGEFKIKALFGSYYILHKGFNDAWVSFQSSHNCVWRLCICLWRIVEWAG